jgi:hypothetical protein
MLLLLMLTEPLRVQPCYPGPPFLSPGEAMVKSELLAALRTEIHKHDFSHFVDEPPSIAQGGRGVVVPGCPMCRKRFGTAPQFLDHLTDDVLPAVLDRLSQTG